MCADGDFEAASHLSSQVQQFATEREHSQAMVWAAATCAESLLCLGRAQDALIALNQVSSVSEKLPEEDRASRLIYFGALAHTCFDLGHDEAACTAVEKTLAAMRHRQAVANYTYYGYTGATETLLRLLEKKEPPQRQAELQAKAREACKALNAFAMLMPFALPRAHFCQGWLYWTEGKTLLARCVWKNGLIHAKKLQMPFETRCLQAVVSLPANSKKAIGEIYHKLTQSPARAV